MTRLVLTAVLLAVSLGAAPDQSFSGAVPVTLGTSIGKTRVLKTGTLVTIATTADQVLLTYTVTTGKTLYLNYFEFSTRITTFAATSTNFGTCSLESPAGTKLYTQMLTGPGASVPVQIGVAEPVSVPAGAVVRLVCTPAAATSFTWVGNFGGYEN